MEGKQCGAGRRSSEQVEQRKAMGFCGHGEAAAWVLCSQSGGDADFAGAGCTKALSRQELPGRSSLVAPVSGGPQCRRSAEVFLTIILI